LAANLQVVPDAFAGTFQIRNAKPALTDTAHPDHALATVLCEADMALLPLLDHTVLVRLLTAGIAPAELEQSAGPAEVAGAVRRVLGPEADLAARELNLPPRPRLREVYAALVESDRFRAACGRISASYAW
jgi:hypothetical protein